MKIFDNRGVTLVELLIVISLTFITLPVIYGVFHSGLKLYEKIQYEGQMRDDADYVTTMIMNKMYSIPFDSIKKCENTTDTCVELVDNTSSELKEYVGDNSTFYDINQKELETSKQTTIRIELHEDTSGHTTFTINDSELDVESDFDGSSVTYSCSKDEENGECKSAIINLNLAISNPSSTKTLQVESKFGF